MSVAGDEKTVLLDEDGATLTGTSWDFSAVTNFEIPNSNTATADAEGEFAIDTDDEQLIMYVGGAAYTLDFTDEGNVGYIPKTDGSGTITWQADETGGSPAWSTVAAPTTDVTINHDAGEETNFTFTGNYTTGSQFLIQQLTGNPTGGVLFEARGADADSTVARFGDGTNYWEVSTAGVLSNAGTGTLNFAAASDLLVGGAQIDIDDLASITASASEINTPLDGASVQLAEFQQLEAIGATTISAAQWVVLGSLDATLLAAELNQLDGKTMSGSDATIVTGTAGTDTYYAAWNADGDLVDGAGVPYVAGGTDVADADVADNITITAGSQIASGSPTFTAVTATTFTSNYTIITPQSITYDDDDDNDETIATDLTSSVILVTGDNDSDNDSIDLQDGTVAGQILTFIAVALVDDDDTFTIDAETDSTCTGCPDAGIFAFDDVGDKVTLYWTGAFWSYQGSYEVD